VVIASFLMVLCGSEHAFMLLVGFYTALFHYAWVLRCIQGTQKILLDFFIDINFMAFII